MVTVNINNSLSQIEGLTITDHASLKKILSYNVTSGSSFMTWKFGVITRSLLTKKGGFPTGLLYLVKQFLKTNNIPHTLIDHRRQPKGPAYVSKLTLPFTPYAEQEKALKTALDRHRGIISAVTGFGKSVLIAMIADALKVKTLIVVPTVELKNQLRESFSTWFDNADHITIENIDSNVLKKANNYDCLIIDEAHHSAASTYRKLNSKSWNGIYYRFFFTATPYRSKDEETIVMESVTGRVIYSISYQEAVAGGFIVPVEGYFYEVERTKVQNLDQSWNSIYHSLVVRHGNRNNLIATILNRLRDSGASVLCLVKEIEHGNILSDLSKVHFANGQDKDSADLIRFFSEGKLKALIGTVGILGEGVDTRAAEFIVIAGLGKSRPQFLQMVGRGVRKTSCKESCKVIIFLDKSHKFTTSHFKEQCKIMAEYYGIEVVRLDI